MKKHSFTFSAARLLKQWVAAIAVLLVAAPVSATKYEYVTYKDDPLHTLVYTLPNGLKVMMSVNKDEPRIQTNIAVRVGSKNDPAETTGLAHYFEHMMFKGTKDFGTTDYEAELPMLDRIEELFEVYRATTDSAARADLYHQIDSISYEASKIAIPNEYDKLMASIGANGTNAYTSYDYTCYVENIPSNELERWAQVQANRIESPVLRGFHTELETIYEEKNMSLTKDSRKMSEAMMSTLFPTHPYGQWSVLGHQQHLKNPSITNIKKYHDQWYVPNNMAILLAGDFDPDEAIDVITKYFGNLKPNENLTRKQYPAETPITEPIVREVFGNESESIMLAWPFPGYNDTVADTLQLVDAIMNNGKSGIVDKNLNKRQEVLGASAGAWLLTDRSAFILQARPKGGQTLDDVRTLLLAQIDSLRQGQFDESLIEGSVNNGRLQVQRQVDTNNGRIDIMEELFVNDLDPDRFIHTFDNWEKIDKQQIVDFARRYFGDNYVAIYKRQGEDTTQLKIAKQPITPIVVNRDTTSTFLRNFVARKVEPIAPVFVDFDKDLTYLKAKSDIPVLYKQNTSNDLFQLSFLYEFGHNNDLEWSLMTNLFSLLATQSRTNEEIAAKFFQIACSYGIRVTGNRITVSLSGLSENMPQALELVEEILAEAVPDQDVYDKVADRLLKNRVDAKKNQSINFSALRSYIIYGADHVKSQVIPEERMRAIRAEELTDRLARLNQYEHTIIYYGPLTEDELLAEINAAHRVPEQLTAVPERKIIPMQQPEETIFFIAPYNAKQLYMAQWTNDGRTFDPENENLRNLYNEYFGGGMNSIVFQEMREARSLAYSAWAVMQRPSFASQPYQFTASIATQNDKLADAIVAFDEIIEQMPESQAAFDLAKDGIDARLRTERIIKDDVAWQLISNRDLGIEGDQRAKFFEQLPAMTLQDVVDFQQKNVKGRTYYYGILGDPEDLDLDFLRSRGRVVLLTPEDIFGY